MKRNSTLTLNGTVYSQESLSQEKHHKSATLPFELEVLKFCWEWLNGSAVFTLQTSGSTGTPKSITLTRDQLEESARRTAHAVGLKSGYTALISMDPAYIAGKMMIVRSFVMGMDMVAVTPSANPLEQVPGNRRIDFASFVPYQLKAILASPKAERLNELKVVLVGGAPPGRDILSALQRYQCAAYITFGMTETISHIALQRVNGESASYFFTTLPGVEISTDERDCLVIRAPYLSAPVITNDLVDISSPDTFRWKGRYDNMINTGGIKVSPESIEMSIHVLLPHRRFFVGSIHDERLGQRVVLAIEGSPFGELEIKHLLSAAAHRLTRFEVPKEIYFIPHFPLTPNGKLDRPAALHLLENSATP